MPSPLCASVPLCLSSCLGASYRLSVISSFTSHQSSFVPLCLCAFVPLFLCAFPQCLAGKCPSRLDQESSVLRMSFLACPGIQYAFPPLCLCAFVPLCLSSFVPLCLCAFVPFFTPLCLCASLLAFVPLCLPSVPFFPSSKKKKC